MASAAVFPVFFAWFFLVLSDQLEMALLAALMVTVALPYLRLRLHERTYYHALGPALVTPDEIGDLENLKLTATVNGKIMQLTNSPSLIVCPRTAANTISQKNPTT